MLRQYIIFAFGVLFIAVLVSRLFEPERVSPALQAIVARRDRVPTMRPTGAQPAPELHRGRTTTLRQTANGHFHAEAVVNGRPIDFIIDTGASPVVLRESAAASVGIFPFPGDYTVLVSTANGKTRAAPVILYEVGVGDVVVLNVTAMVLPDEVLKQNLLGMSFLSKVNWEHRNGTLVLEQ